MKHKLCAVGEAILDFIPEEKGRRLKDVVSFQRVAGGAPANVAGAVAKLGGQAKMITKLGEDAFGDHILECLKRTAIDTSAILRTHEGDTSLAFVSLAEDGNRDFMFYRRSCADKLLAPDDIKEDALQDCGILHFCSVSLIEAPIKYAHKKLIDMAIKEDVLISFDPNLRLSLWEDEDALRTTVKEFIPYADILKISDEELEFITGCTTIKEALPQLMVGRVKLIIYTMGKDGAAAYFGQECVHVEGCPVAVKDTTGAGDSFIGAFLYELLKYEHHDLRAISSSQYAHYLRFANGYAAFTTTKAGALDAMATRQQIDEFLKANAYR